MVGNIAQIYSPYLYNKASGPQYLTAMIANSVFVFGSVAFAVVLLFCLKWENRKIERAEAATNDTRLAEDDDAAPKTADNVVESGLEGIVVLNSGFRYAL